MSNKRFTRREQAMNELFKVEEEVRIYRGLPESYGYYRSYKFKTISEIVDTIDKVKKILESPVEKASDKQMKMLNDLLSYDYNSELKKHLGDKIPNKFQASYMIQNLLDVKKCLTFGSNYDMHPDEFEQIDKDIIYMIDLIP